jgi:hypothetical protein
MPYKFNATTGLLDLVSASADTSLATNIPQYDTDPTSPTAQDAWVLKSGTGSTVTGGGVLKGIIGLSTYYISAGVSSGGAATTYQFSYRTKEGTTIRVQLS